MNASSYFEAGQLQAAIDAQIKDVKAKPEDAAGRLFLFTLMAFAGDLERARRQIEAVSFNDVKRDTAVLAYRDLLEAEQVRRRVLREAATPHFLKEPPPHVHLRLEALRRLLDNQTADAGRLLEEANAAAGSVRGQLNGKPFESLRDCDDLFGTLLEVMNQNRYAWVPLEQVKSVTIGEPRTPRHLLWVPAKLEMQDGQAGDVFLPALYPGSHEQPDDRIRLGRMTDWKTFDDGPVLGMGQHTFFLDEGDIGLLEWRHLEIQPRE
jgi:type VI secretion system protein ImpE